MGLLGEYSRRVLLVSYALKVKNNFNMWKLIWIGLKKVKKDLPKGKGGWGRPSDAKLQFALLPSMIGLGSIQALVAASASRNVTWV